MLNEHHIEDLLRRSNPEPDVEALRMEPHDVRFSASSIVEGRHAMSTSLSRPRPPGTQRESPGWKRGIVVATAAAVVILVLVGGIALLTRTGSEVIEPTAPSASVSLLEGSWERSVIDELDRYVSFEDLEATSFGLVAAATMEGIWMSEDAVAWHQTLAVPYEPSDLPPETVAPPMTVPPQPGHVETYVRLVTEYDGALYATGTMAIGQDTPDDLETRFLIWRSDDGSRWDEITLESARGASTAHPLVMLAADDALFIFADDGSIYRSEDGERFTRFGPEATGTVAVLSAVAQTGDGFVAVGETAVGEDVVRHAYGSPDGIVWTQIPGSEFPPGYYPYQPLVEFDGALYLGGLTFLDEAAGAVWRSTDGESFELVELGVRAPFGSSDDARLVPMYAVEDLIVTPHGLLVVGHVPGVSGNHQDVVMLASEDGITYEPVSDPEGLFTESIQTSGAFFDGRVVMTGHEPFADPSDGSAYQWVWTP